MPENMSHVMNIPIRNWGSGKCHETQRGIYLRLVVVVVAYKIVTALSPNLDFPFLDLTLWNLGQDMDLIFGLGLVNNVIFQEVLSSHWPLGYSNLQTLVAIREQGLYLCCQQLNQQQIYAHIVVFSLPCHHLLVIYYDVNITHFIISYIISF